VGNPDRAFGRGDGLVKTAFTATSMHDMIVALGVRQQASGKLLVAGTQATLRDFQNQQLALLRLNADGPIDEPFGILGPTVPRTTTFSSSYWTVLWAADEYIVFVGEHYLEGLSALMTRLAPDGSLDAGFGDCGTREFDETSYGLSTFVVGQQSDGKL